VHVSDWFLGRIIIPIPLGFMSTLVLVLCTDGEFVEHPNRIFWYTESECSMCRTACYVWHPDNDQGSRMSTVHRILGAKADSQSSRWLMPVVRCRSPAFFNHTTVLAQTALNIGSNSPLKVAYSHQAENLMRNPIIHITRLEFLPCFKSIFDTAIVKSDIKGGFRVAGLVLIGPEAIIPKLEMQLRTLIIPSIDSLKCRKICSHSRTEVTSKVSQRL
jgi:hypothetical protein